MKQLRSILDTISKYTIISALAALGMGIILIFASPAVFRIVCMIFGLLLLIPALLWIYDGVMRNKGVGLLVPGVIFAVAGAFVLFRAGDLAILIGVFFGIFLLIAGLVHIGRALFRRLNNDSGWFLSLILGVGVCAFGMLCILRRGEVSEMLMKIYGVSFLVYAAAALISALEFKKTVAAADAALTEALRGPDPDGSVPDAQADDSVVRTDDSVVEVDGRVIEILNDDADDAGTCGEK